MTRFKKHCIRCDKIFRPHGKNCKFCDVCIKEAFDNRFRNGVKK